MCEETNRRENLMKAKNLLVVAVIALMLMIGWSVYAQQSRRAKTTWEYKRVQILGGQDSTLSDLGAQGWELVAIDNNETAVSVYVFKRAR
jgi:hypothetical protein